MTVLVLAATYSLRMRRTEKPDIKSNLPFAAAAFSKSSSGFGVQKPPTLRQVLVAEDQYVIALDLSVTLEHSGVRVLGPVATLPAAMALLNRHDNIAGAVLDVTLHGDLVYPLAEALRRRGVPFIFHTAHSSTAILPPFRDTVCCEKPLPAQEVVRALQAEMARLLQERLTVGTYGPDAHHR